jgi:hypothetical protein
MGYFEAEIRHQNPLILTIEGRDPQEMTCFILQKRTFDQSNSLEE